MTVAEFIRWLQRIPYSDDDMLTIISPDGVALTISSVIRTSDALIVFTQTKV